MFMTLMTQTISENCKRILYACTHLKVEGGKQSRRLKLRDLTTGKGNHFQGNLTKMTTQLKKQIKTISLYLVVENNLRATTAVLSTPKVRGSPASI
jgi:hypothetical protein